MFLTLVPGRILMRLILISLLALAVLMSTAANVYACSGFVDCLFGFTERTEVRAQRDVETARIQAGADEEIARIEGEANQRVAEAQAEIERVKNTRYADEQQAKVAIAAAESQANAFIAQTNALVNERIRSIEVNADAQMAALNAQTQIAIVGIQEVGQTQRTQINGFYIFRSLGLLVLGDGLVFIVTRRRPGYLVRAYQNPQLFDQAHNRHRIEGQAYRLPVQQNHQKEIQPYEHADWE